MGALEVAVLGADVAAGALMGVVAGPVADQPEIEESRPKQNRDNQPQTGSNTGWQRATSAS